MGRWEEEAVENRINAFCFEWKIIANIITEKNPLGLLSSHLRETIAGGINIDRFCGLGRFCGPGRFSGLGRFSGPAKV